MLSKSACTVIRLQACCTRQICISCYKILLSFLLAQKICRKTRQQLLKLYFTEIYPQCSNKAGASNVFMQFTSRVSARAQKVSVDMYNKFCACMTGNQTVLCRGYLFARRNIGRPKNLCLQGSSPTPLYFNSTRFFHF